MCFIAEDLVPLSIVDSTRFNKLLHTLDPKYQTPSRKHLSTVLLKRKYDSVKNKILKQLEGIESINLTLDLWSNRQMKSFLGVTGHFISKDWKMESMMLVCNHIRGRHTAENIVSWYDEITSEYDITDKIKHIVTDNASNVKKAFLTLPGFEQEQASDNEDNVPAYDETEDYEVVEIEPDELSELATEHHACFAHTLQLVVKDGLNKAGQIENTIKKCSKMVSFLRKSTIAADVLNGEKRPEACNATRWNLQLKMIRSVLTISEEKLAQVEGVPCLTAHDRNILYDIIEILTPFEEAMDFAQLENIPPAGYVLPCIRGLRHQLQKMTSKYHSLGLKESFEKRMIDYKQNTTYIHAAILDPHFKMVQR